MVFENNNIGRNCGHELASCDSDAAVLSLGSLLTWLWNTGGNDLLDLH